MSDLLDVARATYTDEIATREVGYPVRIRVLGEPGKPPFAFALGPLSPNAPKNSTDASYAWRVFDEDDGAEGVEKAFREVVATWREECRPNMREANK